MSDTMMSDTTRPSPPSGPDLAAALAADANLPVTERILPFWFGAPDDPAYRVWKPWWFERSDSLDAAMITLFTGDHGNAKAGRLDDLMATPMGALALMLLLDQVPRNIYRGRAKAFEADAKARAVATHILREGFDEALTDVQRLFCYLPFEHSEDSVDQDRSVALFERLGNDGWLDYAWRHHVIIARFGRFPHRNAAMGRESTAEEIAFLAEPGSSF